MRYRPTNPVVFATQCVLVLAWVGYVVANPQRAGLDAVLVLFPLCFGVVVGIYLAIIWRVLGQNIVVTQLGLRPMYLHLFRRRLDLQTRIWSKPIGKPMFGTYVLSAQDLAHPKIRLLFAAGGIANIVIGLLILAVALTTVKTPMAPWFFAGAGAAAVLTGLALLVPKRGLPQPSTDAGALAMIRRRPGQWREYVEQRRWSDPIRDRRARDWTDEDIEFCPEPVVRTLLRFSRAQDRRDDQTARTELLSAWDSVKDREALGIHGATIAYEVAAFFAKIVPDRALSDAGWGRATAEAPVHITRPRAEIARLLADGNVAEARKRREAQEAMLKNMVALSDAQRAMSMDLLARLFEGTTTRS